jgi:hypothetical protein
VHNKLGVFQYYFTSMYLWSLILFSKKKSFEDFDHEQALCQIDCPSTLSYYKVFFVTYILIVPVKNVNNWINLTKYLSIEEERGSER